MRIKSKENVALHCCTQTIFNCQFLDKFTITVMIYIAKYCIIENTREQFRLADFKILKFSIICRLSTGIELICS